MPLADFYGDFKSLCLHLQRAKLNHKTGQAYLLIGDNTDYLERFALAWAQTAACQEPQPDGQACRHCQNCQWFEQSIYPELRIIRPQSKSRMITIDAMRDFEHWIGLAATQSQLKIGLIVEAEAMGDEAQNAFLKTLEEPPPNTMLLLLTVNSRKLLPTIRSRCQILSLLRNRVDYDVAAQKDLFPLLAPLARQTGAALGMATSAKLHQLFSELHKDAEAKEESFRDANWDKVEDAKIKKELEEKVVAQVEAEYVRMRDGLLGAIQAWFLQRLLIATGVQANLLPHQEFIPFEEAIPKQPPTPEEADQDVKLAEELTTVIKANVDERLALDSFCLQITAKGQA